MADEATDQGPAGAGPTTEAYEALLALVKKRRSCRRFRPDPIPDGSIEKILEAARWAMSGANSQPWEFIVVREPARIKALYDAYREHVNDLNFWLEQRFPFELRHPGFRIDGDVEEQYRQLQSRPGWSVAPALIVVLGDGRRQLGSVSGASTPGRHQTHLTDALSNASMILHLAAASLGLATQWVSIHIQEPFKQILDVPPLLTLHTIVPVGYPHQELAGIFRRKLSEIVHAETYERAKFMTNEDIVRFLYRLRAGTIRTYVRSRGEQRIPGSDAP
jgi:5,6-dimethylbenzimidazole synthase